jgi:hypothetical protein
MRLWGQGNIQKAVPHDSKLEYKPLPFLLPEDPLLPPVQRTMHPLSQHLSR